MPYVDTPWSFPFRPHSLVEVFQVLSEVTSLIPLKVSREFVVLVELFLLLLKL